MQSLKLANDLFGGLNDGSKRVTVRKGRRDIQLGYLVFEPTDGQLEPVVVNVIEVKYKKMSSISEEEASEDGFVNLHDMFVSMQRFYPDLSPDSEMTLIYFQ